jgi:phosphonopyruvate decarboxylase
MLNSLSFLKELQARGFDFYSGVPCSFLKDLINGAINGSRYVMAANEGDAVALAAGAYLGGSKPVVLMQNSGLGNAVSPLTSLNAIFKIPVLGFVSLRGEAGLKDEPQHELMGQITSQMLETMRIPWSYLPENPDLVDAELDKAEAAVNAGGSYFFVVKKTVFDSQNVEARPTSMGGNTKLVIKAGPDEEPSREAALRTLVELEDRKTAVLATTGKTGRELCEIKDFDQHLYMVGSMGCASSLGLGLAMTKPDKKIIAIDGDGALLMRMGALATNAFYAPKNLLHIVLDNQSHDSTGGQFTASSGCDFVKAAAACGYPNAIHAHSLGEFKTAVQDWQNKGGLTFLNLKISSGSMAQLGRPKVRPHEVKDRLMRFLNS